MLGDISYINYHIEAIYIKSNHYKIPIFSTKLQILSEVLSYFKLVILICSLNVYINLNCRHPF